MGRAATGLNIPPGLGFGVPSFAATTHFFQPSSIHCLNLRSGSRNRVSPYLSNSKLSAESRVFKIERRGQALIQSVRAEPKRAVRAREEQREALSVPISFRSS